MSGVSVADGCSSFYCWLQPMAEVAATFDIAGCNRWLQFQGLF
jgi:hypothetical protein